MTWTIRKAFTFSASHQLEGLPAGHKCGRLHGHNYLVTVELTADQLDRSGFVLDFGELASFRGYLDGTLDHRHLNDELDVQPTAELLAQHLHGVATGLYGPLVTAVQVLETPTSWAEYRP